MSGKVTKVKIGEDFYSISASGSSRMAKQASEYSRRAATRARERVEKEMGAEKEESKESGDSSG